jgi:hypothetical protein
LPLVASSQNPQTRQGFGISFGFGSGSASLECTGCSTDRTTGNTGFLRIGGYVRPNLFLAGESNAWVHTEGGVQSTIGMVAAVAQWYPSVTTGFYLMGGLGLARYLEDDGTNEVTSNPLGLILGAGYDIRLGRNFSLTPFASFVGTAKGELLFNDSSTGVNASLRVMQFGLGFTWH